MSKMIMKRRLEAKKNKKKGFTLIELTVVIVIIAIIAAIAVPALTRYIESANKRAAQAQAHNIQVVLQAEVTEYYDASINGNPLTDSVRLFTSGGQYGAPFAAADTIDSILERSGVNITSGTLTHIYFSSGRAIVQFRYVHNATVVYYLNGRYTVLDLVDDAYPVGFNQAT